MPSTNRAIRQENPANISTGRSRDLPTTWCGGWKPPPRNATAYRHPIEALQSRYDAIVMPVTPVPAFRHDHSEPLAARTLDVDGRTIPYPTMLGWIALATALHLPSLAVPAGCSKAGLPIGV